jgi:hypothetical protein
VFDSRILSAVSFGFQSDALPPVFSGFGQRIKGFCVFFSPSGSGK